MKKNYYEYILFSSYLKHTITRKILQKFNKNE